MQAGELHDAFIGPVRQRGPGTCVWTNATRERIMTPVVASLRHSWERGETVWMRRRSSATTDGTSCLASGYSSTSTASSDEREQIGDFTLFGPSVQIYTAMHPMNVEVSGRWNTQASRDRIRRVGGAAIICPGVKIGSKTVIRRRECCHSEYSRRVCGREPFPGFPGNYGNRCTPGFSFVGKDFRISRTTSASSLQMNT